MVNVFRGVLTVIVLIIGLNIMGQGTVIYNGKVDTTVSRVSIDSLKQIIYRFQAKAELQLLELGVLRSLKKTDTARYGKDSLVISFIGKNGSVLKTVKREYGKDRKEMKRITAYIYYGDSTITYNNKNGLLSYQERWRETYELPTIYHTDTVYYWRKLTYRRYEYDSLNRLTRQLIYYPSPMMAENTFSYDAQGNVTPGGRRISLYDFWGSVKETLKK